MMPEKYYERLRPLLESRSEDFDLFLASKELLKTLTGYKYYQVSHSDAKAELVSGPECVSKTEPVRLGEKFIIRTVFRLPW